MAKKSFCYPGLPEDQENIITHNYNWHANYTASTMQELPANASFQFQGYPSWSPGAASTSKSHRQAEKRRRDRINAQLARLRSLIPKSEKMDKAALLERVVEEMRDLKRKASEISKFVSVPTEIDEVSIECNTDIQQGSQNCHDNENNKNMLIKATFCCEDRPDLVAELIRALKGLNLTTIGADIACLGGRMKSILVLYYKESGDGDEQGFSNVSTIKQSLMAVLSRVVSWSTSTPNFRVTSKRQRFFFSP